MKTTLLLILNFALFFNLKDAKSNFNSSELISTTVEKSFGNAQALSCEMSEEEIIETGTPNISIGDSTIYIGRKDVEPGKFDSIILKFTRGELDWCETSYEGSIANSSGYGLFWTGTDLYAVFSIDRSVPTDSKLSSFTSSGWVSAYGDGEGSNASVVFRIKINDGSGIEESGTFIKAVLGNGRTNSVQVSDIDLLDNGNLLITSNAFFSPINTDQTPMSCSGSSPFEYTLVLDQNLQTAICASALNCDNSTGENCLDTLGTNTSLAQEISIYFSKADNKIIIDSFFEEEVMLTIYDMNGRVISNQQLKKNLDSQVVDVSSLNSGLFICKVSNRNISTSQKIWIQ